MLIKNNNPHGGDIYQNKVICDFSANISPLGTPKEVIESVLESVNDILSYPDAHCNKLREKLSAKIKIDKANIICGNGAADLIFGYALALKPKKALIVSPTFSEYEKALKSVECNIERYTLSKENSFDLDENILPLLKNDLDVLVICNPNNPTGRFYPIEVIENIAKICNENNIKLFIDECFFDLTGIDEKMTAISICKKYSNIAILKAFTKSYGMAGVRLGYLISFDDIVLNKMSEVMQVWNVSTLAQNAGIAALSCDYHIKENVELILKERKYLESELTKLNINFIKSTTNYILFNSNVFNLYEILLKKGVMIRKCENFNGLDNTYYRIAVKNHNDNTILIQNLKEIFNNG